MLTHDETWYVDKSKVGIEIETGVEIETGQRWGCRVVTLSANPLVKNHVIAFKISWEFISRAVTFTDNIN